MLPLQTGAYWDYCPLSPLLPLLFWDTVKDPWTSFWEQDRAGTFWCGNIMDPTWSQMYGLWCMQGNVYAENELEHLPGLVFCRHVPYMPVKFSWVFIEWDSGGILDRGSEAQSGDPYMKEKTIVWLMELCHYYSNSSRTIMFLHMTFPVPQTTLKLEKGTMSTLKRVKTRLRNIQRDTLAMLFIEKSWVWLR